MLVFWRMSDQLVGLLASFAFLILGSGGLAFSGDSSTMPLIVSLISLISFNSMIICLGFFFVTFPDGRFVPRWSWLIGCTLAMQAFFFEVPGPLNILSGSWPLPLVVIEIVLVYSSPIVVQVYRYRHVSNPAQRQQTKWVIFGLVGFLLVIFVGFFTGAMFSSSDIYQLVIESLPPVGFLIIPLSISIAIQRSQLWDIDVIINRTLAYGLLTLVLALVYVGLIFGGDALLVGIVGKNDGIVIVGSTLIVAVLFQQLRQGIQNVIDRRFYRKKYNAQRTLQAFSAALHQEIDLAQLSEQIVAVVQETVQPAHVSLWLFNSKCPEE